MTEESRRIPVPVVKRLTKYLVHVEGLQERGIVWVSSEEIAEALGLTSSTVRQDLSHLDFSGISNRGYETERLERILGRELGADRTTNVIIVGIGNLGRALARHAEFGRRGFRICALFDASPRLVGKKVGDLQIQGMASLPRVVKAKKIDIALIAVPGSSAQEVTDILVAAGVKGLLNLTLAHVRPARETCVVDARIIASLQELLCRIK